MNIKFSCSMKTNRNCDNWDGFITKISNLGSYYELQIESRSGFSVIIGKNNFGNFVCIPSFDKGCYISLLDDIFWNSERLCSIMNKVDGITVAYELKAVSEFINLD